MSISPCENFYEFACGNFHLNGSSDYFEASLNQANDELKNLLSEDILENDLHHVKLVKTYYQSCLNGSDSVIDYVRQKINEIDWLDDEKFKKYSQKNLSLTKFIMDLQFFQYDDGYFFTFYRVKDGKFFVNQPYFSEDKVNILEDENGTLGPKLSNYSENQAKLAIAFGMDPNFAASRFRKVLDVERELKNMLSPDESIDAYNFGTIDNLLETFTSIDWKIYFERFSADNTTVSLYLRKKEVFSKINRLILNYPKKILLDYVVWCFIRSAMYNFEIREGSIFEVPISVLESNCIAKVKDDLELATSYVYLKHSWNQTIEVELRKLAESLRLEKLRSIEADETWPDNLKLKILRKLITMKFEFGYFSELENAAHIKKLYKGLDFKRNIYIDILRNVFNFKIIIHEQTNFFLTEDFNPNGFYIAQLNEVFISAAIIYNHTNLGKPPNALNYGSMGFFIAHEITHSIEFVFESESEYSERYKCIKNQYDNYIDQKTGLSLNGSKTLIENIADIGGMKLSYHAYNKWLVQNENSEAILSGLNFTSKQLFWITFAQEFCTSYSRHYTAFLIKKDTHAILPFRVNGVVENLQEFSDDFKCPKDAKMNPQNKCRV